MATGKQRKFVLARTGIRISEFSIVANSPTRDILGSATFVGLQLLPDHEYSVTDRQSGVPGQRKPITNS
ncbi:hypothetical protein PoB_004706400 [Plakobranchus ocellatus]|uniref:Uncharacterized protein n=1 Tax=Plakobranchus ocellatus TaxID=259542 RepID=A0AAV4BNY1_9GAST|nr:hypothetical protein PoB_004706400 [Plakobranchus ocellatus]